MDSLFEGAKAKVGTWPERITSEELSSLPLFKLKASVVVVDTLEALNKAILEIYSSSAVVGIDTESKPSWTKGDYHDIALVQIATRGVIYLIRTNKIGFPKELWDLLEDPKLLKVGIGLKDDLHRLSKKRSEFKPSSWLDLSKVAKSGGIITIGLRNLIAIFLKRRLSKKQQLSNWENEKLTPAQQHYSALDAWSPLVLFWILRAELVPAA